jgi:membrane-associated protease RseP (regulator of RpoE activity)
MNRQEIDEMMSQLPSQQPEESLLDRWIIGTMFIVFLVVICMLPDIMR